MHTLKLLPLKRDDPGGEEIGKYYLSSFERLYLAGGFGNYIRVESAMRIGLLPVELKGRIVPIGNAAGTGARFALKSIEFEKEIDQVIKKSEYVELSMRPDFNEAYVAAMMFEYAFDLKEEGKLIRVAVAASMAEGFVTEDIAEGPAQGTAAVGDWIADWITKN